MPKAKKIPLTPKQKAALKLEKKRLRLLAAEEKKKQIIRDYLSRELKYGLLSTQKLEKKLKPLLHNLKLQDLGIEFQLAVANAERLLDAKNLIISILMDELDMAHGQYNINFGAHCERLDDLLNSFLLHLQDIKVKYEGGIQFLKEGLNEEINELNKHATAEAEYLSELQFGNKTITKEQNYETSINRLKYIEEMKQKYIEDQSSTENVFEKKFIHFWNSYKNIVQSFQSETCTKKKQYDEFQEHNKECTEMIKINREKLFQQYVYMKKEKDRQELESDKYQQKIDFHTDELHRFKVLLDNIKKLLEKDEKSDQKQLISLIKHTEVANQKLKKRYQSVEKILKMYGIVRKYETEKEKILAFPKMVPEHIPKGYRVHSNRNILEGISFDSKEFINFWQRVASSDKSRNYLNEEMEVLIVENKKLRKSILDCLSSNPNMVFRVPGIDMKMICKKSIII